MNPTILVAIISAVVSLVGTAIGAYSGAKLTAYRMQQLEKRLMSTTVSPVECQLLKNKLR